MNVDRVFVNTKPHVSILAKCMVHHSQGHTAAKHIIIIDRVNQLYSWLNKNVQYTTVTHCTTNIYDTNPIKAIEQKQRISNKYSSQVPFAVEHRREEKRRWTAVML